MLWKKALSVVDRMTDREKYRTLGLYYGTVSRDYDKAIENYAMLVKLYPADGAGHNNLALAYFSTRNFAQALEEGRRALDIYPRKLLYRANYALYAMYASDFKTAQTEAERILKDEPGFSMAYLPLAVAALSRSDVAGARDLYRPDGKNRIGRRIAGRAGCCRRGDLTKVASMRRRELSRKASTSTRTARTKVCSEPNTSRSPTRTAR